LAGLYTDLSTARRRLSIMVADHLRASAQGPTQPTRARLAHAVLGCRVLDRVAELPALARQHPGSVGRAGADLVTQADAVASVAARLAVVLRGPGTGFRGDLAAPPGLAGLAGLGPNETDASLILAAENVSLALSLATRVVLVLARLHTHRRRARRVVMVLWERLAGRAAPCAVRVASLPWATDLAHGWSAAPTHLTAVVVGVALAASVLSVGRRARPRHVGPVRAFVDLLGEVVGAAVVVASVALPHAALLVLVDVVIRAVRRRALRPAGRGESGCVGFTCGRPRPHRTHPEHRDLHRETGVSTTRTRRNGDCHVVFAR
jgi:hypothetical protein